ncbi:methyltransferase domain-containing protein [Actinophytocola sp.]|uniref:methyltransferase domain-containing protein n=1 Tax=Actinophytocola sp. TaxID=1872138 RepID=UPI002D70EB80|nr:methyltransferase domain-containing protein [Actinophytocola sp.]HYQ67404.1 methyltransferase domain-containing protein [Actinophytocola sp.]
MPDGPRHDHLSTGDLAKADVEIQIAALDRQSRLPGIPRLRAWSLAVLGLKPGERVLDIGSGTGEHARLLAEAVGETGEATGVDPNEGMRAEAARRAPRARFVPGDAYELPFPDGSLDAVTCERLFQHLHDPDRAAREIGRVLRPGGRTVITDTDWGTAIIHPGDPDIARVVTEAMRGGIANPFAARRLAGHVKRAGLTIDDVGSQALVQSPSAATGPLVRMLGRMAVDRGVVDAEGCEQFLADLAAAAESGDFHMSVTMFAVLAHR